jgi:enamine deaminase RidA (YjgF/YER057c/UK114 family)
MSVKEMIDLPALVRARGLELPPPPGSVATYAPFVRLGNMLLMSGQIPFCEGRVCYTGHVGRDVSLIDGAKAAQLCLLNILAHVAVALQQTPTPVLRCLKLGGFIQATDNFTDHAKVMNGASDLMVDVLGEHGRHARSTIGVASLPLNAAVEIDALFTLEG